MGLTGRLGINLEVGPRRHEASWNPHRKQISIKFGTILSRIVKSHANICVKVCKETSIQLNIQITVWVKYVD